MGRLSVILLVLSSCSAAAGQLLLKIGAHGREQITEFVNIPILLGLLSMLLARRSGSMY